MHPQRRRDQGTGLVERREKVPRRRARRLAAIGLLAAAGSGAPGGVACDGRGSELQPARRDLGPPLGCTFAPEAPGFVLHTPSHRAVVPRIGHHLGEARVLRQWILRHRCTGLWLVPVVPASLAVHGVVLDVAESRCAGG